MAASPQTRLAAMTIIVTMLAWMGASFLGGMLNLPQRFAFLLDLAAIAAFAFAIITLITGLRADPPDKDD